MSSPTPQPPLVPSTTPSLLALLQNRRESIKPFQPGGMIHSRFHTEQGLSPPMDTPPTTMMQQGEVFIPRSRATTEPGMALASHMMSGPLSIPRHPTPVPDTHEPVKRIPRPGRVQRTSSLTLPTTEVEITLEPPPTMGLGMGMEQMSDYGKRFMEGSEDEEIEVLTHPRSPELTIDWTRTPSRPIRIAHPDDPKSPITFHTELLPTTPISPLDPPPLGGINFPTRLDPKAVQFLPRALQPAPQHFLHPGTQPLTPEPGEGSGFARVDYAEYARNALGIARGMVEQVSGGAGGEAAGSEEWNGREGQLVAEFGVREGYEGLPTAGGNAFGMRSTESYGDTPTYRWDHPRMLEPYQPPVALDIVHLQPQELRPLFTTSQSTPNLPASPPPPPSSPFSTLKTLLTASRSLGSFFGEIYKTSIRTSLIPIGHYSNSPQRLLVETKTEKADLLKGENPEKLVASGSHKWGTISLGYGSPSYTSLKGSWNGGVGYPSRRKRVKKAVDLSGWDDIGVSGSDSSGDEMAKSSWDEYDKKYEERFEGQREEEDSQAKYYWSASHNWDLDGEGEGGGGGGGGGEGDASEAVRGLGVDLGETGMGDVGLLEHFETMGGMGDGLVMFETTGMRGMVHQGGEEEQGLDGHQQIQEAFGEDFVGEQIIQSYTERTDEVPPPSPRPDAFTNDQWSGLGLDFQTEPQHTINLHDLQRSLIDGKIVEFRHLLQIVAKALQCPVEEVPYKRSVLTAVRGAGLDEGNVTTLMELELRYSPLRVSHSTGHELYSWYKSIFRNREAELGTFQYLLIVLFQIAMNGPVGENPDSTLRSLYNATNVVCLLPDGHCSLHPPNVTIPPIRESFISTEELFENEEDEKTEPVAEENESGGALKASVSKGNSGFLNSREASPASSDIENFPRQGASQISDIGGRLLSDDDVMFQELESALDTPPSVKAPTQQESFFDQDTDDENEEDAQEGDGEIHVENEMDAHGGDEDVEYEEGSEDDVDQELAMILREMKGKGKLVEMEEMDEEEGVVEGEVDAAAEGGDEEAMPDLVPSSSGFSSYSEIPDHDLYTGSSCYAIFFRVLGIISQATMVSVNHVLYLQDVADVLGTIDRTVEEYMEWMIVAAESERIEARRASRRRHWHNFGNEDGHWRCIRYVEALDQIIHFDTASHWDEMPKHGQAAVVLMMYGLGKTDWDPIKFLKQAQREYHFYPNSTPYLPPTPASSKNSGSRSRDAALRDAEYQLKMLPERADEGLRKELMEFIRVETLQIGPSTKKWK